MKYNTFAFQIASIDPDFFPDNLKQIFVGERECVFRKEILYDWMGIKHPIDQRLIVTALKRCPEPLPRGLLHRLFLRGRAASYAKEKEVICWRLAPANLCDITVKMGDVDVLRSTADNKSKVLHLAIHGNVPTGNDNVPTLAFRDNGSIVNAENLTTALALCCKADGISTYGNGSIECVFLNASFTYGLAKLLKERYRVRWILSWETEVDDETEMCFAEAFYHFLGCL